VQLVVDTSFWIDFVRQRLPAAEALLIEDALREERAVMPQLVWLELTVGLRSPVEQRFLQEVRSVCCWEPLSESDGAEAEKLAAGLRKQGVVLAASDLLILTVAWRLGAPLLHHDEDFTRALKLPEFIGQRVEA
jgi:predicted nucleic acid-binding protein